MPQPVQSAVRNQLLQAMHPDDFEQLAPFLQFVELHVHDVLVQAGAKIDYVHFIESGIGSVVASGLEGKQIELGHVGREGLVGRTILLGVDMTTDMTFVQVAGAAHRIAAADLAAAVDRSARLRGLLLRYVHVTEVQVASTALANSLYTIHERLARWLLMYHDRLDGDDLSITHEFLSLMLGVRRAGITSELHVIEGMHIIRATRGNIRVLDRTKLVEIAGDSYGVAEREYVRLLKPTASL
jgi:CRP-like cAMP-binding protein